MITVKCGLCAAVEEFNSDAKGLDWLGSHECQLRVAHCPDCGTQVVKETVEEAIEVVNDHNRMVHDEAHVAGLGPTAIYLSEFESGEWDEIEAAIERTKVARGDVDVVWGEDAEAKDDE